MEVWILDCAKLEMEVLSGFLSYHGHKVKTFEGRRFPEEAAVNPDVLVVGLTANNDQGLRRLEHVARLEKVAFLFPGVPVIAVTAPRFSVPVKSGAAGVIHSFIHRPVPLEELEMELRHLDC